MTDATWFKSVGYDAVFWTRIGAQAGLFALGLVVALVVPAAQHLARRSPRPASGHGRRRAIPGVHRPPGPVGTHDRREPVPRAVRPVRRPSGGGPRATATTTARSGSARSDPASPAPTCRTSGRSASSSSWSWRSSSRSARPGALSGSWQTVALYAEPGPLRAGRRGARRRPDLRPGHQLLLLRPAVPAAACRRRPAASCWRRSSSRSPATSWRRSRGSGFTTPVRVHLGVLAGLYLLTVAAGYQLDKLELVYSTNGVATGVSYTDQAARFFANDALTIVAGLVAVLLVFARVHPLGVADGGGRSSIWLGLSLLLGVVYPEAIQRFTVDPNQYAQEQPYIANNIAMTRLAYALERLAGPGLRRRRAPDRRRGHAGRIHVPERPPLGLPAPPDHAGADPDRPPVLPVRGRGHGPLHDQRQPPAGDAVRPRAGARAEPAGRKLGQPAGLVHPRLRPGHGPGQRGGQPGPSRADHQGPARDRVGRRSPGDASRGSTSASGRTAGSSSARASPSSTTRWVASDTGAPSQQVETRWTGTTGIKLDSC